MRSNTFVKEKYIHDFEMLEAFKRIQKQIDLDLDRRKCCGEGGVQDLDGDLEFWENSGDTIMGDFVVLGESFCFCF